MKIVIFVSILSALVGCQTSPVVTKVISADTIILKDGRKVRYAGVSAPEENDPWFEYTRAANEYLVQEHKVYLVEEPSLSTEDTIYAYVYTPIQDGEKERKLFVNAELIKFGYASVPEIDTEVQNKELWNNLLEIQEKEAKFYKLGIWSGQTPSQKFSP